MENFTSMARLTAEQIKRASKLAMKGVRLMSGDVIQAMRNANYNDKEFIPLADKKKLDLQKPIKEKGGMK